jgi:hypothetical protein
MCLALPASDPLRKPTVHRSIREYVGNSRPATAPDPLLDHLVGSGQQRFPGCAVIQAQSTSNLPGGSVSRKTYLFR